MDCCDSAKRLKPPFESLSSHRLRDFVSSWSRTALRAVRCFPGSVPLFSKCGIVVRLARTGSMGGRPRFATRRRSTKRRFGPWPPSESIASARSIEPGREVVLGANFRGVLYLGLRTEDVLRIKRRRTRRPTAMEASEEFTGFADPPMVAGSLHALLAGFVEVAGIPQLTLDDCLGLEFIHGPFAAPRGGAPDRPGYTRRGWRKTPSPPPPVRSEAAGRGKVIKAVIASAE